MHFFIVLNGLLFSMSDFNGYSLKPNNRPLLWSIKWNLRSLFLDNNLLFRLNDPNNDLLFYTNFMNFMWFITTLTYAKIYQKHIHTHTSLLTYFTLEFNPCCRNRTITFKHVRNINCVLLNLLSFFQYVQ